MTLSIGVDVGGTKVLGGVVNEKGEILKTLREDTPKEGGSAVTKVIADVVLKLSQEFNIHTVGVAVPGYVSSDRQRVLGIPNIKDLVKQIEELLYLIKKGHKVYIHCAGGYRSVIAASLFKRQGFHNLRNILGGWQAIEQHPFPIVKGEQLLNE